MTATLTDDAYGISHRRLAILGQKDLQQHTGRLRFQLVGDLLGADISYHHPRGYLVAFAHPPAGHRAALHRQTKLGHLHYFSHLLTPLLAGLVDIKNRGAGQRP